MGASQLYVGGTLDYSATNGTSTGDGIINQTAGTLTLRGGGAAGTNGLQNWLVIGDRAGVTGTYNMTGGAINVVGPDALSVAEDGMGLFNVSGTSAVTASNLYVGRWTTGAGTVNLSGGSMSFTNAIIGHQGTGSFNHSDGVVTIGAGTAGLAIGFDAASHGTYTLSGNGVLSTVSEYIGYSGSGTLNQTDGFHTANANVYLGFNPGGSGSLSLSGGTFLIHNGNEFVGYSGRGTLILNGGTHSIPSGTLVVSFVPNSSGTVNLISGGLAALAETIGGGSGSGGAFTNGVFNQSGGGNSTPLLKIGQGNAEHPASTRSAPAG